MIEDVRGTITEGRTALGIEFGSTRIKAVLIGEDNSPLATGGHDWESQFVDRVWTYPLNAVTAGLQAAYASLAVDVRQRYGAELRTVGALGVSAMMHGYLAFDASGGLLVPFRTWRNTVTGPASTQLGELFGHSIPQRWSIAHLYQAILNDEDHVGRIAHLNTLAGYVHWRLTGEQMLGVGDASGMFPIDIATGSYHAAMVHQFDTLVADRGFGWKLGDILPSVRAAGEPAGRLTAAGAALLDPSGTLQPGSVCCPPEGDAGTGMVATNSVAPRTGNVSAGTSIFAMVVLEHDLSRMHPELDLVTTPSGDLVAMVHCNNGASEVNAWVSLFGEFAERLGATADTGTLFESLFTASLDAEPDCGGLLAYNYLSGEHITGLEEGRPLFVRTPDSRFTLANFMRSQLYAALSSLRIGMNVLLQTENVQLDSLFAHGGLFKTKGVAQRYLAAAVDAPVSVGDVAGEGGAWGIALLAGFTRNRTEGQSLADYLGSRVFAGASLETMEPDPADVAGFDAYLQRFSAGLPIERSAIQHS
jgi:sugar (pentulose or hexulose) kinase